MSTKQRQDKIIEILEEQGYVTVKSLCQELRYSSATVNRDLNELSRRGIVLRSYGGAELSRTASIPVTFRVKHMRSEKRHISRAAAAFVNDGDTIFIDGSTTVQYMEQYLTDKKSLTVITTNVVLTVNLSKYNNIKVICLGGAIYEAPCILYGVETVENAKRYKVDKMFFSTQGMTSTGVIASNIYEPVYKAIAKNAGRVFYLVGSKKIDPQFDEIYGDASSVDYIISNHVFPPETVKAFPDTEFITVDSAQ